MRFANATLNQGHTISCVFLYQEAVYHASEHIKQPNDEFDINACWQQLNAQGIELLVCVTAAEKRGCALGSPSYFNVAGLAEFAMLASEADKWVQFKWKTF